jgi:type VI secretion system protein ImpM
MCGVQAAIGLMLPSVDRAGRYFPLTFAALSPCRIAAESAETWLDICEAAGRDALEHDTPPEEITDRLGSLELPDDTTAAEGAVWWSDGSARVQPARMVLQCLPDAATYAAMLGAHTDIELGETKWEST